MYNFLQKKTTNYQRFYVSNERKSLDERNIIKIFLTVIAWREDPYYALSPP